MSDLYLPLRVGSDVALLLGMAHVIAREGLIDRRLSSTIAQQTVMPSLNISSNLPRHGRKKFQGYLRRDIETAAKWYGESAKAAIYYTLGITEHICGVDNVQSLCNLALMTGNIGREGTGINPMRGQNNIQGAGG